MDDSFPAPCRIKLLVSLLHQLVDLSRRTIVLSMITNALLHHCALTIVFLLLSIGMKREITVLMKTDPGSEHR